MTKGRFSSNRIWAYGKRATSDPNRHEEIFDRWCSRVDDARIAVAGKIVVSVKAKWRTAVALEAATGICRTEISRIRRGNLDRFSLDRLVWLLSVVDPATEVQLKVKVASNGKK
jgi:hypothetical protein